MGLKVWLQLNGNLNNIGCSNIQPINHGAVIDTNGQIGKCYTFNGTNQYIDTGYGNNVLAKNMSVTLWIKPLASLNSKIVFGSLNGSNQRFYLGVRGGTWELSYGAIAWNTNSTSTADLNTWQHLAVTIDNEGVVKLYKNGVYTNETVTSNTNFNLASNIVIGGRSDGYYANCAMNDVRIYDHCLSAAEIHEISQGLVLHYKLDSFQGMHGNANLLKSTPKSYNSSAYCAYQLNFTENLVANQTYTLQLWDVNVAHSAKSAANLGIAFYWGGGSVQLTYPKGTSYFTDGHADYIKVSFTPTEANASHSNAANLWFNVYNSPSNANGTRSMSIGRWKLEKGSSATPWQDSNDTLNIIQDSSGYNHDGILTNTAFITSNTPRYSNAIYLSKVKINCTDGFPTGENPNFTISFWTKILSTITYVSYGDLIGMYDTGQGSNTFRLELCGSPAGNNLMWFRGPSGQSGGGFNMNKNSSSGWFTKDTWHHIVLAGDGINKKYYCYLDGNLCQTYNGSANSWQPTGQWYLGDTIEATAYFSDLRIYCTTLDADAIRQLYEIGAKVDNKENLHTFEIIEPSLQKITKQGQIKGQNLLETYLPLYDKTIYTEPDGSTWIHIFHHNNPAASKFNETTLDWTTGKYLDADRWYDVDQAIYSTLGPYEFMVKQKTTNTATEVKYRWIQTINPLTAVWEDVKPGQVTFNTTTGYTNSSYGGMYIFKTTGLHMCIANSSKGNWYGGIGAANAYNGGIPGFPNTTVTTGSIDLYIRIYNGAKIIKDIGVNSNEFIEI